MLKQPFQAICVDGFDSCYHETIFRTPQQESYLLEGSTFSLLGIKDNTCIFLPLQGNTNQAEDLNTGYILESTTMRMLHYVAKQHNIPHVIEPILYSDVQSLQALYCVSTTRFKFSKEQYQLQPCTLLDSCVVAAEQTPVYEQLMQAFTEFVSHYTYNTQADLSFVGAPLIIAIPLL